MMDFLTRVDKSLKKMDAEMNKLTEVSKCYKEWWYTQTPMGKFEAKVYRFMGMEHTLGIGKVMEKARVN